MADRYISDLVGTLRSIFGIGNRNIKNVAGILTVRDEDDTQYEAFAAGGFDVHSNASGFKTTLRAAAGATGDTNFTLPPDNGASGQALVTDAAGNLSYATVGTGANQNKTEQAVINFNDASPIAIFTPPDDAVILRVTLVVDTDWDDNAATLSVGIAGDTARDMGANENKLGKASTYEVAPYTEVGTPADQVIVTLNSATATQGAARLYIEYANPS